MADIPHKLDVKVIPDVVESQRVSNDYEEPYGVVVGVVHDVAEKLEKEDPELVQFEDLEVAVVQVDLHLLQEDVLEGEHEVEQ